MDEIFLPLEWKPGELLPCGAPLVGYTPYRSYSTTSGVQVSVLFGRETSAYGLPVFFLFQVYGLP